MQGLRDLEYAVKELGFVGAHLYPHWFGLAPDHAKYYPYYAKCCELDVPIMMQVGHNLIYSRDRRLPSVGRPICLDQVAIDFPELKLLGIHIGIPWTDEMISMAWKHENVFIGVDAYAPKHWLSSSCIANAWSAKIAGRLVIDPERAGRETGAAAPPGSRDADARHVLRVFRLPEVQRQTCNAKRPDSMMPVPSSSWAHRPVTLAVTARPTRSRANDPQLPPTHSRINRAGADRRSDCGSAAPLPAASNTHQCPGAGSRWDAEPSSSRVADCGGAGAVRRAGAEEMAIAFASVERII